MHLNTLHKCVSETKSTCICNKINRKNNYPRLFIANFPLYILTVGFNSITGLCWYKLLVYLMLCFIKFVTISFISAVQQKTFTELVKR